MFKKRYVVALAALILLTSPAVARNDVVMLPVATAMNTPDAQQRINHSIRFYFGSQPTPPVARDFGSYVAHRKTNGFAKSEATSCDWAFLAALIELQDRALKLGGNAVINIESDYNRHAVSSPTDYECHKGMLMAGVVLRGNVVRLAGR